MTRKVYNSLQLAPKHLLLSNQKKIVIILECTVLCQKAQHLRYGTISIANPLYIDTQWNVKLVNGKFILKYLTFLVG